MTTSEVRAAANTARMCRRRIDQAHRIPTPVGHHQRFAIRRQARAIGSSPAQSVAISRRALDRWRDGIGAGVATYAKFPAVSRSIETAAGARESWPQPHCVRIDHRDRAVCAGCAEFTSNSLRVGLAATATGLLPRPVSRSTRTSPVQHRDVSLPPLVT